MNHYDQRMLRAAGAAGDFGIWRPNYHASAGNRMVRAGLMRSRFDPMPNGAKEMLIITEAGRRALAALDKEKS